MKTLNSIYFIGLFLVFFSCEKQEITVPNTIEGTDLKSAFQNKKKTLKETLVTKEASFNKREGHTQITHDNKIWVMGGYEGFNGNARNDIWNSKDGVSWVQLPALKHFSPRTSHTTTIFKGKLWVIGGNEIPNRKNDVWQSSDGKFWQKVTNNAGFSERSSHTSLVFDNRMWVIGGLDQDKKAKNDVWYSKNGIDWIQATSKAAFSPRFNHTAFIYDGLMWVVGGRDGFDNQSEIIIKNDVWYSKNGIDWVKATSDAAFLARSGHTSVVYDGKMWVLGGSDKDSNKINDVWCSKDGAVWNQVTLKGESLKRTAHTTTVFDKKMWVIGGIDTMTKNDVWSLK